MVVKVISGDKDLFQFVLEYVIVDIMRKGIMDVDFYMFVVIDEKYGIMVV